MSVQEQAKKIEELLKVEKRAATKQEGLILLTATLENTSTEQILILVDGFKQHHKEVELEIATQLLEKRAIPRHRK